MNRYFPILDWGRTYSRLNLTNDLVAALIVTIMLIPQSLAYALLAGLPAEAGIYASIVPIVLYAITGTSRTLAVGPVAVVSLMTAAAIGQVAETGTAGYAVAALTLAFLSGAMLLAMGLLRLGFVANFLSHPVIAGFITASGLLIATGQLGSLLGIKLRGDTMVDLLGGLTREMANLNPITLAIGLSSMAFLYWARRSLKATLRGLGVKPFLADLLAKAGPIVAVATSTLAVWALGLDGKGVAVVGAIPQSLPPFTLPSFDLALIRQLALPALMISLIGFVESVSISQTLAARKRQRIAPDQELIGLGLANLGAAFTGGFPVTGGFARSVVNADAGAETPAAGAFTAAGLALAALFLTPFLFYLPKATLAATIIVAVLSLVDLSILRRAWGCSKADFAAVATTLAATLIFGVETGVSAGVGVSLALFLYHTTRPHVAEVGLIAGSQHFRNIHRYDVITDPAILTLRFDQSLYFANVRFLEDMVLSRVTSDPMLRHVILMCSAINEMDMSALEGLESLNLRLKEMGILLHLSEVKGPVMDHLTRTQFLRHLSGQVFISQFDAFQALRHPDAHGFAQAKMPL